MPDSLTARHPGEILVEEFLAARSLSQYRLAVDVGVPPRRINEIVHGKRGITADTALRLSRYFGNDPLYWMELQSRWDLQRARERLGGRLTQEVPRPGSSAPPGRRPGRPRSRPAQTTPPAAPQSGSELADHLL